jgi:hypothetical protein
MRMDRNGKLTFRHCTCSRKTTSVPFYSISYQKPCPENPYVIAPDHRPVAAVRGVVGNDIHRKGVDVQENSRCTGRIRSSDSVFGLPTAAPTR